MIADITLTTNFLLTLGLAVTCFVAGWLVGICCN